MDIFRVKKSIFESCNAEKQFVGGLGLPDRDEMSERIFPTAKSCFNAPV